MGKLTAKRGNDNGYHVLYVNGVSVSEHHHEREVIEAAQKAKFINPADDVRYRHILEVVVDGNGKLVNVTGDAPAKVAVEKKQKKAKKK